MNKSKLLFVELEHLQAGPGEDDHVDEANHKTTPDAWFVNGPSFEKHVTHRLGG